MLDIRDLRHHLHAALRERDEWAAMCGRYKQERDDAREALRLASQKAQMQAAVFKREDLRDNSRWSIFNEGRAQALEKFANELEGRT